jgi:hypothetical protein
LHSIGAVSHRLRAQAATEAIGAETGRNAMRLSTLTLIAALGGGAMLSGCAEDYYGGGYYPYGPYADVDYTGYYDNYYGPFNGGYWGPGGYFYYADRGGQHYHRDSGGHFRHDPGSPGGGGRYHEIHGRAPPARAGGGGHGGGRAPH